jgi:hypothetical protein
LQTRALPTGLCCHPNDLCTDLIAREAGILINDENGQQLRAPLNVEADVSWIGYANQNIRARVEPTLRAALQKHGLMPRSA